MAGKARELLLLLRESLPKLALLSFREIVSTGYVTAVGFGCGYFVSLFIPVALPWAAIGATVAFVSSVWKGSA